MSAKPQSELFIEKRCKDHDLAASDSGNASLTNWLHKFAWTNQQSDSAKTYVVCRGTHVAGYYSLSTGSIHKHESPERIAEGPANHHIGVVLLAGLAGLAVDRREHGQGIGKAILEDTLRRVEGAADIVAVRAVLVHAIDDAVRRFYEHFNLEPSPIDAFQRMLLLKDVRISLH